MALYKQRGSNIWWFEFQFDKTRIRRSSKTTSKKLALEAERACRRHLEERYNGITKRTGPKQFGSAAEEYLTAKSCKLQPSSIEIERYNIRHLSQIFRGRLLTDVTALDIKKYQDARINSGAAKRTVNLEVATLRAILKRNALWETIRSDVSMLRDDQQHGCALTSEQEKKLLAECRGSNSRILYVAVTLAFCTGLRFDELRSLTWRHIDLARAELTVGQSKTRHGAGRVVPLNRRAITILQEWAEEFPNRTPEQFLFPAERGGARNREGVRCFHHQDPSKPIGSWRKGWEKAKRIAGVPIRFHDIRHTVATRLIESGVPMATVGSIMGWSPSTTVLMIKRYAHLSSGTFRKAVEFLE